MSNATFTISIYVVSSSLLPTNTEFNSQHGSIFFHFLTISYFFPNFVVNWYHIHLKTRFLPSKNVIFNISFSVSAYYMYLLLLYNTTWFSNTEYSPWTFYNPTFLWSFSKRKHPGSFIRKIKRLLFWKLKLWI